MALTLNNFNGFESRGFEGFSASSGATIDTTTPTVSGDASAKFTANVVLGILSMPIAFGGTANQGDKIIGGGDFMVSDVTPATTSMALFSFSDGFLSSPIRVALKTDGDLSLIDSNDSEVAAYTPDISDNNWFHLELIFDNSATGDAKLYLNGQEVISVTGEDFSGAMDIIRIFNHPTTDKWADNLYIYTGASATDVILGADCFIHVNDSEDDTDVGDTLDAGTWANVGDIPIDDGSEASYTSATGDGGTTCDEGNYAGPYSEGKSSQQNRAIDPFLIGAINMIRAKRGNGGGTTHSVNIGNTTDGMTAEAITLSTSYENFFRVIQQNETSIMPRFAEDFQHGFKVQGARDMDVSALYSHLLVKRRRII